MKVNFYNGIKKLKNKITLVKDKVCRKIKNSNFVAGIKKHGRNIVLGSVGTAIILSSLTGCKVSDSSTYNYVEPSYSISSDYDVNQSSGATVVDDGCFLSYNRFLYGVKDSLDDVVILGGGDSYDGISMSGNNADRRLAYGEYVGMDVSILEEAYNEFVEFVDNKDVIYAYQEYFNIDEALAMTGANVGHVSHTNLITDINSVVTVDQLMVRILANNELYLKDNPEFSELSYEDIYEFAMYVVESLNNKYDELSDESKERVYCELGNLKVVGFDSSDITVNPSGSLINAQYCSDGTVVIDKKQIDLLPNDDAKAKTYKHEVEHIYHRDCEDTLVDGYQMIGVSQYFDNLNVNPLFWRWQYEAAAESNVMREYGTQTAVVYQNFVNYLRSLDLIALINPDYKDDALEISTINHDPEDLYKIFGALSLEEQKEIIKMMYAIDYLQVQREDLENEYASRTGNSIGTALSVKYELKNGICTTMTKYFYKMLAERVFHADVSLEDVFYLINVFEADLNSHINYDEAEERNRYFIDSYLEIQNSFFELLATDSCYSLEDIIEMFNTYAMVIRGNDGSYKRNACLSWLDENERQFVYGILTHNIASFTSNIRDMYGDNPVQLTKNP